MTGGPTDARPPRGLVFAVCAVAGASLLLEILISRFFSVLFFYHYSFFAVTIVMTGLAFGGLWSARALRGRDDPESARRALARSALLFAIATLGATLFLVLFTRRISVVNPGALSIALLALAWLPALTAAGFFLATVFSAFSAHVARLYAADLTAAAAAVAGAVWLLRAWPGPAAALVPASLASAGVVALARGRLRAAAATLLAIALVPAAVAPFLDRPLLPLPSGRSHRGTEPAPIRLERWNEHSRILIAGRDRDPSQEVVIDKTAMTHIVALPPRGDGPLPHLAWATGGIETIGYRLGRPCESVAVIGVGGGRDLISAVVAGARRVDGYELNGLLIDALRGRFLGYSGGLAEWPEVRLVHDEGRVGIAASGRRYDLILASMIDTWAATAGGGFVLSENGLYTVDAWTEFLGRLTDRGVVSMTRWHIPAEPAELHRLVVVAATALERAGLPDPGRHLVVCSQGTPAFSQGPGRLVNAMATVLASRAPFSLEEIARLEASFAGAQIPLYLLHPGRTPDEAVARLIAPGARSGAIATSRFDITPPSDDRPYFFLQVRPTEVFSLLFSRERGELQEIVFNGVRVLLLMSAFAFLFAAAIGLFAFRWRRTAAQTTAPATLRWATLYFSAIGFGFLLVQLGLLQRLVLILGHPTYAFTVILFSMLLTTGLGAALSRRVPRARWVSCWAAIFAGMALLALAFPLVTLLGHIASRGARLAAAGCIPALAGLLAGFAFPIGVRLVAPMGESAVQRMWAVNGAAGVAGTGAAALLGLTGGSRLVVAAGAGCYLVMLLAGWAATRAKGSGPAAGPDPFGA